MVLRDFSYDPPNCERIVQLILATADMVGQTAHLSRAVRSRCEAVKSICGHATSIDSSSD